MNTIVPATVLHHHVQTPASTRCAHRGLAYHTMTAGAYTGALFMFALGLSMHFVA
jgi:hypothetical protein